MMPALVIVPPLTVTVLFEAAPLVVLLPPTIRNVPAVPVNDPPLMVTRLPEASPCLPTPPPVMPPLLVCLSNVLSRRKSAADTFHVKIFIQNSIAMPAGLPQAYFFAVSDNSQV
jgi:hypothetical protein